MNDLILVTGGSGFLALHVLDLLLRRGVRVRTTLRDLAKQAPVLAALQAAETPHLERLSFAAADLTEAAGWAAAMTGVTGVVSVAAPVFVNGEATNATIETAATAATAGTRRIFAAAAAAGVRRIVWTGNLGAVGFSNHKRDRVTTEADWTRATEPGLSAYERSKLTAEQAAWQYAREQALALTVINAGAMLGPALGTHVSGSFGLVRGLLAGPKHFIAPLTVNVVDVRDVAALHVAALFAPAAVGQRFLAVAPTPISLPAAARAIAAAMPELAPRVATRVLPAWLIRALAPINATAREGRLFLAISHRVSTAHAQALLGWQPQYSATEAVLAAAASLLHDERS